jgi:hypothetical protein
MNQIKEIIINVKTNGTPVQQTENKDEESTLNISNKNYIPLTYSMIVIPPPPSGAAKNPKQSFKYNETPFFTNYISYKGKLESYLYDKGYEEVLKFFFNQSYFKQVLRNLDIVINPALPESTRNTQSLENITCMIKMLFPTTFPAYNNIITSYGDIFEGNATSSTRNKNITLSDLYNYLPKYIKDNFASTNRYSYLKINGGIHTIYRVVLINDIINHPKFNFLINAIHTFFNNFEKERNGVIDSLINRMVELQQVLQGLSDNKALYELEQMEKQNVNYGMPDSFYQGSSIQTMIEQLKSENIFKTEKGTMSINKEELKTKLQSKSPDNIIALLIDLRNELDGVINRKTKFTNANDINKIQEYLKYFEIYYYYYQYNSNYLGADINVPSMQNIFYNTSSTPPTRRGQEYSSYGYGSRGYREYAFNVKTEAKDIMQKDKGMANYKKLFEEFNQVSNAKILTDNIEFNKLLNTFVNTEETPSKYLMYLYQFLSLLKPEKNKTLSQVLDAFKNGKQIRDGADLKQDTKDYCRMTVINTMEQRGKTKKTTEGKYLVYLHLDLIAGKLDDTNLSEIQCKYRGEQLGDAYLKMLTSREYWEINALPYLKLNNKLAKPPKAQKGAPKGPGPTAAPSGTKKRSSTQKKPLKQPRTQIVEGGRRRRRTKKKIIPKYRV